MPNSGGFSIEKPGMVCYDNGRSIENVTDKVSDNGTNISTRFGIVFKNIANYGKKEAV